MFAKLFETKIGQILVKLDDGEDAPEVRYFFEPPGLGVCSVALQFADDSDGEAWDKAEHAFDKTDEGVAIAMVENVITRLPSVPVAEA
jgi:hypothetical protein